MRRHAETSCHWVISAAIGLLLAVPGGLSARNLPMVVTSESARATALASRADDALRYAVGLSPSLNAFDGETGGVSIFSAGALSLGLRIRLQQWPADVPLAWQSDSMEAPHLITPRSAETQWLPDVPGDMATLTWARDDLPPGATLTLERVFHGYRAFHGHQARALGSAQTCNIDAVCEEIDWDQPVRSTVMVTVEENDARTLCSGAMLNNTANDDRPLLITARHCDITRSNANSVIATFNYQRSVCGGANDGVSLDTISSSTWLGESVSGDTTLLELSREIPGAFDPHFSGWSAVAQPASSGAGIHHPDGDQKKISLFTSPVTVSDNVTVGDFNVDAWRVRWNSGTTQAGSSGSGLWDQDRRLVGVLSGGSHSCDTPTGDDFYGRLPVAWDESSAIRNALDPVTDGTARSASGRDLNSIDPPPSPTPPSIEEGSGGGGTGLATLMLLLGALIRRRIRAAPAGGTLESKVVMSVI